MVGIGSTCFHPEPMAGPVEMARLVSILARARFPEQGQPSKASSGFQTWLRQSCFEWALRRQEIPCPHRGGKDRRRIADRRPRRANWPASGPHPAFRRSGEFRRGLCVNVAGVVEGVSSRSGRRSNGSASRRQAALGILPLLLRGRFPIWHDRCRPLFNSASSCLS